MLESRPALDHWKAKGIDLSAILYNPPVPSRVARRCVEKQDHGLEEALDYTIIEQAREALEYRQHIKIVLPIRNVHRTVGAMSVSYTHLSFAHAAICCYLFEKLEFREAHGIDHSISAANSTNCNLRSCLIVEWMVH